MSKKIAIISGASRGLGREIAISLAKNEYFTIITYANSPEKANDVVNTIEQFGGKAISLKADVGNHQEVKELFENVKYKFGRIDVVINTAGISILKPLAEFQLDEFYKVIETNVNGTFNILSQASKHIEKGGRILTFSSNVVNTLPINYSIYAASKSAVETMSKIFSKELRGKEVTVNIISPGPTSTEMFLEGKNQELIEQFAKLSPFERIGTPIDIINVINFLISPDAVWINGQVIKINGGSS